MTTETTTGPSAPSPHRGRVRAIVATLVAVYAAYFSLYTTILHGRLKTYAFDLGTFDQGIWLAGHGTNYFVTVRGLHLLGDHVRLFSFVLAPLYWIWDDVRALLVAQSVAIAAGAWLLMRIAERAVPQSRWFAVAIAASWLVHPAVQNLNLDHAHPDAFASTLIVAAVLFLRETRMVAFWIAMALAMSCKEDVPLVFVAMGAAMLLRGERRTGARILAVSGAYFALCMIVILPHFNGHGFFRFEEHYFLGGVGTHHRDPSWIFERVFRADTGYYLLSLGAPLLFLFVLAPWSVVPALPSLAVNVISDATYMRSLEYHYQAWILPFLYIGTIDAYALLTADAGSRRALTRMLPASIAAAAVVANLLWAKVPLGSTGEIVEKWNFLRSDASLAKIRATIAKIPPGASVSADYTLVPQLSHRERIYLFPNPYRVSNWGIVGENSDDPDLVEYVFVRNNLPGSPEIRRTVDELVADERLTLVESDSTFGLYKRVVPLALSANATCGDWDGDGKVTLSDMRRIGAAIMKNGVCPLAVCDADGDRKAAYADVLRVAGRARGDDVTLDCPLPQR